MTGLTMPPPLLSPSARSSFLRMIEERVGLRLSVDQAASLDSIIIHMLAEHQYASPSELLQAMAGDARSVLLEGLAARLTVGETHFFRVAPQMEALRHVILPDLLKQHAADRRLAVWSAGCSTGEEPYTLAMLLREQLPAVDPWTIQLLATDLSHQSLARAREAHYGAWSFRSTPEAIRQRYFARETTGWRLSDAVRRMVNFAHMNIASDTLPEAFSDRRCFDLIVCRNVTIYFSPDATQRLYQRFADLLAPGGWLMLGPSDPPPAKTVPLEATYLPGAILWRLPQGPNSVTVARPNPTAPSFRPGHTAIQALSLVSREAKQARGALEAKRTSVAQTSRKPADPHMELQALSAKAHLDLGMSFLEQGMPGRAIECLRRATFLEPDHALAQFSLGRAYIQTADVGRARAALRHARRVLAALPDTEPVAGSDTILIGDLRHAIDVQLMAVAGANRV